MSEETTSPLDDLTPDEIDQGLSGSKGSVAQREAVSLLAREEAQRLLSQMVITSPNGASLRGTYEDGLGFFSLLAGGAGGGSSKRPLETLDPPAAPKMWQIRKRVRPDGRSFDNEYEILIGTVSGMGLSNATPEGAPELMTWAPITVRAGDKVYLRVRFEPIAIELPLNEENTLWMLGSGGKEAELNLFLFANLPAATHPLINPTTGVTTQNGQYNILLGGRTSEGNLYQVTTGPLTIYFCAPGTFQFE